MAYRVRILPGALQDARNYYEYLAASSIDTATQWFNGLFAAVETLTKMPNRCPKAPESAIVGREIRCLFYRRYYRILYGVEGKVVQIYHIRHTSQQYMNREDFFAQPLQDTEDLTE